MEIKGVQFGVRLEPRGKRDRHACFSLLSEDDGHWSAVDIAASTFWIADLIKVLQEAQHQLIHSGRFHKTDEGYSFNRD